MPYLKPLDPHIAKQVEELDEDAKEFYQERAGIREFTAGQSRNEAESGAWEDTLRYLADRNQRPDTAKKS